MKSQQNVPLQVSLKSVTLIDLSQMPNRHIYLGNTKQDAVLDCIKDTFVVSKRHLEMQLFYFLVARICASLLVCFPLSCQVSDRVFNENFYSKLQT